MIDSAGDQQLEIKENINKKSLLNGCKIFGHMETHKV